MIVGFIVVGCLRYGTLQIFLLNSVLNDMNNRDQTEVNVR